jgi:hypothetical protein
MGVDAGTDGGLRGGDGTVRRRLGRQPERAEHSPHGAGLAHRAHNSARPGTARTDKDFDREHTAEQRGPRQPIPATAAPRGRPAHSGPPPRSPRAIRQGLADWPETLETNYAARTCPRSGTVKAMVAPTGFERLCTLDFRGILERLCTA